MLSEGCDIYNHVLHSYILKSTFNLPSLSNIVTSVDTNVPCKGNSMTLGLTNGTQDTLGLFNWSDDELAAVAQRGNLPISRKSSTTYHNTGIGVTTDETKSGIVGTITRTQTTCKYVIKY